ncbi:uncharacterized protein MEPE_05924 [Melanopsichium pennsylvanicum]|uniref:Zn(2)-C6 fungal-type domain-containing protein n=2 Tax=Melanopsichium pennsylvanicum TaxID=63383 RepID=A0AAJ4XRL7_9BASI|nr:uncharacterized protein MEPE_05924 [Melanopsichium pennsylvanicum]
MSCTNSARSCSQDTASGPSSSTSRSPSVEPSTSKVNTRRLTLDDIHIPAGFEIAKHLSDSNTEYPSEENIQKAAQVLQSLRGRMPDGSDGQVAACDYCRRRKIRCDRIKPTCGSCVASGRKCTTEDMLRKRGPPSKKERAILEAACIIFRGTRPHRRRRTATTSLGPGAASKQQEEILRKVKEAAGTRTRANSTNSGEPTLVELGQGFEMGSATKSSWMEMLSIATKSTNPFADSPASSPSDMSMQDTFHIDGGACDYLVPKVIPSVPAKIAVRNLDNTTDRAQWDNMWATFGSDLRTKHAEASSQHGFGASSLPNLTSFACNNHADELKHGSVSRASLSASFDAAALDWSASNLTPTQYSLLFPSDHPIQLHQEANMPVVLANPSMLAPNDMHQQAEEPQPFLASPSGLTTERMAFEAAVGHFFPKVDSLSSSLSASSNSSASVDAETPTELDHFIALGEFCQQQQQQQQQMQQMQYQHQNQPQQPLGFALSF